MSRETLRIIDLCLCTRVLYTDLVPVYSRSSSGRLLGWHHRPCGGFLDLRMYAPPPGTTLPLFQPPPPPPSRNTLVMLSEVIIPRRVSRELLRAALGLACILVIGVIMFMLVGR